MRKSLRTGTRILRMEMIAKNTMMNMMMKVKAFKGSLLQSRQGNLRGNSRGSRMGLKE